MKYVYLRANIDYLDEADYIFNHYNRTVFSSKLQKRFHFVDPTHDKHLKRTNACGYYLFKNGIILNKDAIISKQILRETLIHEICHQAVREIDGNKDTSHGGAWRNWMKRCGVSSPKETIRSINYLHEKKITKLEMNSYLLGKCALLLGRDNSNNKKRIFGRVLLYVPMPDDNGKYFCYFKSIKGNELLLTRGDKNKFPLYCVSRRMELDIKKIITNSYVSDFIQDKINNGFIVNHYSTKTLEQVEQIYKELTKII